MTSLDSLFMCLLTLGLEGERQDEAGTRNGGAG